MSRFIEGENRCQSTLFPERVDDYVGEDSDWLMIAENGAGNGFAYGPLFTPSDESANAIRDTMYSGESFATYEVESCECRLISQEVVLPDNTTRTHEFKACRQSDGTWMEV